MTTPIVLGTETVAITALTPHPDNPNHGDVDAIAQSLTEHGQYRPIVINQDGVILAGHHVARAAQQLGWTDVRVERLQVTEQQARKILLADNRIADLGPGLDDTALLALLQQLDGDLTGTGYTDDDLDNLIAAVTPPDAAEWGQAMPDTPADGPEVLTRSFTLTADQAAIVDTAIEAARPDTPQDGNINGAALTAICEAYR